MQVRGEAERWPGAREENNRMDDPDVPNAAGAVVVATGGAQPLFLLLQSSRRTSEWTPPHGIFERTDGDARSCALRQLREECGMTLAQADLKAGFV
ncbi:hypothetical protein T484DRAFT_2020816, partial [Baffinella frigidus]